MLETKECLKCKETKEITNFRIRRPYSDSKGRYCWCNFCMNEYQKKYNKAKRKRIELERIKI